MFVENRYAISSTANLQPGDIFYIGLWSQQSLGLVLEQASTGTSIAILETERAERPVPLWLTLKSPAQVLSLGGGCVFEPILGPESVPGSSFEYKFSPGVLTQDAENNLTMMLHPYDSFANNEVSFDLRRNVFSHGSSSYYNAYFARWRLWPSRSEFEMERGTPILDFQYKPFAR